jgi:hypothetical protein
MYCSRKLGREIVGKPASWEMASWLGVDSTEESAKMIHDFNHGEWEFGCLPPTALAEKVLPKLAKDFEILAITCCSTDPATVALRKANLYHVFGPIFSDVVCQPLGTKKIENLLKHKHRNVVAWVEDKPEAALHGHEMGYPSFLIHQDHNKDYREKNLEGPLNHVTNWAAIGNLL